VETYLRLHRTLRRFQEQNRFVGNAYGSGLSLLESRVLTDIGALDSVTASDLSSSLGLSRTVISRTVSELKTQKVLSVRSDPQDARRQFLYLTAKGKKVLAEFDARAEERLATFCKNLSKGEPERLLGYLTKFGDGLGVPPLLYRRDEHPLRAPIRRVTQGLGLLSNHVFGRSDLSSVEWHILAKLQEQSNSILAKTFVSVFSLPANTVAGIIKRLIDRRWIVRVVDPRDRRQLQLGLSSEGRTFLKGVEASAIEQLQSALRGFDLKTVENFEELLSAMIGHRAASLLSPNGVTLTLSRLKSEQERALARAFCAEHATRLGCASLLEERFFSSSSGCFALESESDVYAVLEIQPLSDRPRAAKVVHLVQLPILDSLPMLDTFVDLAIRSFNVDTPEVTVQLEHEWRG
jgi:DNA-binding MarR family transcriptional regulator